MTAEQSARRDGYAARSELALRNALEDLCRKRWPTARVVHEMVMGGGRVRADVVAIDLTNVVAFEVKGAFDDTTRLMHQIGMYQLCVPEVWMVVSKQHDQDARYMRHLLPSIGLITADGLRDRHSMNEALDVATLKVVAEATPRHPIPEMMLEMLWRAELISVCSRLRVPIGGRATRLDMIKHLLSRYDIKALQRECCAALRGRDALWRADAPVT